MKLHSMKTLYKPPLTTMKVASEYWSIAKYTSRHFWTNLSTEINGKYPSKIVGGLSIPQISNTTKETGIGMRKLTLNPSTQPQHQLHGRHCQVLQPCPPNRLLIRQPDLPRTRWMRLMILHTHNLFECRQRSPDPRAGYLQCALRDGCFEELACVSGVRSH